MHNFKEAFKETAFLNAQPCALEEGSTKDKSSPNPQKLSRKLSSVSLDEKEGDKDSYVKSELETSQDFCALESNRCLTELTQV